MTPYQARNPQTMMQAKPGNQTVVKAQQASLIQINNMIKEFRMLYVIEDALDSVKEDYDIDVPFDTEQMKKAVTSGNTSAVRSQLDAAKKVLVAKGVPGIPSQIDQAIALLAGVNRDRLYSSMNVEGLGITKNFVDELLNNVALSDIGVNEDVMSDLNRLMTQLSPSNPIKTRFFTNL